MALSEERKHRGRPTQYPWEREALDFIYSLLPDTDPYQAWELHELYHPPSGRPYEVDLIFLSRQGLFLVEIKSHPGELTGNIIDWTFADGGQKRTIECPFQQANLKAKILADQIAREIPKDRPWVQAAVFVSKATAVRLDGGEPPWLLTRDNVRDRLVNGLEGREARTIVNRPMMKQIIQAAHRIGLRPSQAARIVSGYRLGHLLDEGEGYQEHLGENTAVERDKARIRSYVVPAATSVERRSLLQRAARREARTLAQIGHHPGILAYRAFVEDAPLGPAVVFEAFEDGLPLHIFLRQHLDLTFDERLGILQQIVEAVAHCHRAGVIHRNLSPSSILASRDADGRVRIRIHRFHTAAWAEHSSVGTRHVAELAREMDRLYQAPEVLSDPGKANCESDVFSVGCLAWLLLTGQHPAPTLAEREERIAPLGTWSGGLRPSVVRADLAVLDEAIGSATLPNLHGRIDDVTCWYNDCVLDALTRPTTEATDLDPREATKGETLPGGFKVERRLGSGGTAIVLQVRRDNRDFALKIPHDQECGENLLAEARRLGELDHEHIVALREVITLNGLPCLLLEFAGVRTLADLLREQGTLPLDQARMYGDELLSAVQYLEDKGVTHKDIKPSNVGFTSLSKKVSHLLLLDFSLSAAPLTAVGAGTAEWRDPWLYLRGSWDHAADRYSAAAVLYHAITASRPALAEDSGQAGEIQLDPERFDAAVRDRLTAFFRCAFARDSGARFSSAEAMRIAWGQAMSASEGEQPGPPGEADLDRVRPDTLIDALPYSVRARNALDRAGVRTVAELLQLPRNQLSVVRGVGTQIAREIIALSEQLRERLSVGGGPALFPGFVRPRLPLGDPEAGIDPGTREKLAAAGLSTTVDAANAQESRVRRLLGTGATQALRSRLEAMAAAEPTPGSLADWVRALIGPASASEASKRLRVLVGLDALPNGAVDSGPPVTRTVPEVAAAFGIDPAQIHSSLQFMRSKRWIGHDVSAALSQTLSSLLDGGSPAIPLSELGSALVAERAGEAATEEDRKLAAGLVRVALELRPDPPASWRRIRGIPWVAADAAALDALDALGAVADRLAAIEPLPSTDAVQVALAEVVAGTPLGNLPADLRVAFAARASSMAAASARLELYPQGMAAARALALSLATLSGTGLTPEVVRSRVAARYPVAELLPDRPELDALLAQHGLIFAADLGAGEYVRPGEHVQTSSTMLAPSRKPTTPPGLPRRRSPAAQRAAAFHDQLLRGVAARRFRVVQVLAHEADRATAELAIALRVPAVSLDQALTTAIRHKAAELGVDWTNVEAADRAGPQGPDWPLLLDLVQQSSDPLVDKLLAGGVEPVLLAWPGAFARYGLVGPLSRLVDRSEGGDAPAVILVVPSYADGLAPMINGKLPVPAPLPGQRLVMPEGWRANPDNGRESP